MDEELLKSFLLFKISVAQKITEALPEVMKQPVKRLETRLMQNLYEITKQYMDSVPSEKDIRQEDELRPIDVQ